jgi:hypothetical protein
MPIPDWQQSNALIFIPAGQNCRSAPIFGRRSSTALPYKQDGRTVLARPSADSFKILSKS